MAIRATRCVAYDDYATMEKTEAEDSDFTVVPADVLDFKRGACENNFRVFEVESAFVKGRFALGRVVRN